jgi:hypothetical protein
VNDSTHQGASISVGVRVLCSSDEHSGVPVYQGVSYCDAVRRAARGETLRVLPGSIQVCRWAPVVLGLKEPQGRFEERLSPRLAFPVAGLLLASRDRFPGEPEVLVMRAEVGTVWEMLKGAGKERLWDGHGGRLDRSAIPLLAADGRTALRHPLIGAVNRVLASLARFAPWQAWTRWLFRSDLVSAGFDAIISRALADMSICRNSTVIPLLTGRVNVSFFCTGGITWGHNDPHHLTSGWPHQLTTGEAND